MIEGLELGTCTHARCLARRTLVKAVTLVAKATVVDPHPVTATLCAPCIEGLATLHAHHAPPRGHEPLTYVYR